MELDDFAGKIIGKMKEYWGHAARNVPLQRIPCLINYVKIHPSEDLEDLLYSESDQSDED